MWLWWVGNVVGLVVVIPLILLLANRVVRPGLEIQAYSDDILEHGVLLTENLVPVSGLVDTDAHVEEVTGEAVRYLTALRRLV